MGYSRNYQKYWDEKKRKRDEEVSLSNALLPAAALESERSGAHITDDPDMDLNASEEQLNDDVFMDCYEFFSGDESSTGENVEYQEMSASSSVDSSIADSKVLNTSTNEDSTHTSGHDCTSAYFNSKTYMKAAVPMRESCSFELMRLLDKAGSPRYLYDEVKALLNKQSKNGFQISEAMSREVLMKSLYHQFACPQVQHCKVSSYDVYKFPFVGMLQD